MTDQSERFPAKGFSAEGFSAKGLSTEEFNGYDDLPAVSRTAIEETKVPRFDGDVSAMPDRACWALQNLLTRRYVSGDRTPQLWSWIVEYQEPLRIRLSELDLRLRLVTELEVAFVEQVGYDSRWVEDYSSARRSRPTTRSSPCTWPNTCGPRARIRY